MNGFVKLKESEPS